MKLCSKEGCERKHYGKGYCKYHWEKWKCATDPEYKQNRKISKDKAKDKWLANPENVETVRARNLKNMKKRYETNEEYRISEQNRTREFRRDKYINSEDFRKKEGINATQRKKHIKLATPKWADLSTIKEFYRNRPDGHHVDHIIPLRGENVSGLHVIDNLQYLIGEENLKKSNKT